jgi:hypothetical protein
LDVDLLGGFEPVNAVSIFPANNSRRPTDSPIPPSGVVHLHAWSDAFPVHLSQRFHKQPVQRNMSIASGRRMKPGVQTDNFMINEPQS